MKNHFYRTSILFIMLALFVAQCDQDVVWEVTATKYNIFYVVATSSTNSSISITFSNSINTSTFGNTSYNLVGTVPYGGGIPSWSSNNKVLTFSPMYPNYSYIVHLNRNQFFSVEGYSLYQNEHLNINTQ